MATSAFTKKSFLTSLQGLFFASCLLYAGRIVFIPVLFGLLLALILYPICRALEARKWPRSLAIGGCLLLLVLLTLGLATLFIWQVTAFQRELPLLLEKMAGLLKSAQDWLVLHVQISLEEQTNWLRQSLPGVGERMGSMLVSTVNLTANVLYFLVVVPLFTILFLYYRRLLVSFLYEYFSGQPRERLRDILDKTVLTYYHYIKGLSIIYLIVGVLNSLGLYLLGIQHALLFGFLASVLTIVPYVGITIGALLPMTIAWLTYDSIWYPLGVVGIFTLVQYLEANVIFPLVVGAQLRVNTLATMVALLAGGALWGLSGVILFLPFVAILKVVADHVTEWKALRILLSPLDEEETEPKRTASNHRPLLARHPPVSGRIVPK